MARAPRWIPLLLVLAALGCGGGGSEGVTVDWDLRDGHTLEDVGWPEDRRDATATQLRPEGPVRIRLADDAVFEAAAGVVDRINLARQDDTVTSILLSSERRAVRDAGDLARRWAEPLRIPTGPIDAWSARAQRDPGGRVSVSNGLRPIGPDGLVATIELRPVPTGERPAIVGLDLSWLGPDADAPAGEATP